MLMTKQDIKEMVINIAGRMMSHSIAGYAAQTAFFTLLSIFPFLILFISLIQFLNISPERLSHVINDFLPVFLEDQTSNWVQELYSHSAGTISLSLVFLLWSSAKALHSMKYGLDTVNGVKDERRWLSIRFSAMGQTLLFILLLAVTLLFVIFGSYLVAFIEQIYLDNGGTPLYLDIIMLLRYFIVFGLTVLFMDLAYTRLPNVENNTMREHLPTAIVCTVIWFILTIFFSIYINVYELFSMYGTLTAAILGLVWIYFCMMVLFGCAECHNEIIFFWEMIKEHNRKKKMNKKHSIVLKKKDSEES